MPAFTLSPASFLGQGHGLTPAKRTSTNARPYACARPQAPARTILTSSAASEDRLASVQTQLEFWFSAANLRRDWYLRRQMDDEGWLDPSIFLHFNRTKRLNATLRDIIDAANRSPQLEVSCPNNSFGDSEAQTRLRRSPDLPDFWSWDDSEADRSFILANIPEDSSIELITAVFERLATPTYVKVFRVEGVAEKALVCFADVETSERVLNNFAALANAASDNLTLRSRKTPEGLLPRYAVAGDTDIPVRTFVPTPANPMHILHISELPSDISWRRLRDVVTQAVADISKTQIRYLLYEVGNPMCYVTLSQDSESDSLIDVLCRDGIEIDGNRVNVRLLESESDIQDYWHLSYALQQKRKSLKTEAKQGQGSRPKGVILKLEGLDKTVSWKSLMKDISKFAPVVYLSISSEDNVAYVRMKSPEDTKLVTESLNTQPLCGTEVTATILQGEEEQQYWKEADRRVKEKEDGKMLAKNAGSRGGEFGRHSEANQQELYEKEQ
ncbi:unnamed protein product [Agarophyton chilense]